MKNLPPSFVCRECETIAADLQNAWKSDLEELRAGLEGAAISSSRDPEKMGLHWIFSMAEMPDDELQASLRSQYPRVAETRRKKEEHEGSTGHSVFEWTLGLHPYKGFIGSK